MNASLLFRLPLAAAFLVLSLTFSAPAPAQDTLEIVTRGGVHTFAVELAATDAERSRGLMYRREVPEGTGMLFDFKQDLNITMWMKNTYVSLDMIFIRADGRIHRIAENTEPESEKVVAAGAPVRAVLEVVAGTARKLGIRPGDRVAHPIFRGR
jgi:uncharacterized membrane protein (UPF0127 family)